MKRYIFVLTFPMLTIFSNEIKAVECPPVEGFEHEVVCGPDSENGQTIWNDERKSLSKLDIIQGTLTINGNSRIDFSFDAEINFDGGGCLEEGECDSSNPADDLYGRNILEVTNSEFFHGSGNNAVVNMKDVNQIIVTDTSSVTIGTIRDQDQYAQIEEIRVENSDFSLNKIDFNHMHSFLREFRVINERKNRGLYTVNINNGIKVSKIQSMIFDNSDTFLGGDIVAYGTRKTGGSIGNINLRYSDLIFTGNNISNAGSFSLYEESVLKSDPISGEHKITMGMASPLIMVQQGSTFDVQNIELIVPDLSISVQDENSQVEIDRVFFLEEAISGQRIVFELQFGASLNIGEIDTRIPGVNDSASFMSLSGDENSTFDIGTIIIDNEKFQLELLNTYGVINQMDYYSSNVLIESNNRIDRPVMSINNINIISANSNKLIEFIEQNIEIDSINIEKATDVLDFTLSNAEIKLSDLICFENCDVLNLTGELIGTEDETRSELTLENFHSGNTSAAQGQNNFRGIKLNVNNTYSSDGSFNVDNSELSFRSINGTYTSINLINNSKVDILEESFLFLLDELVSIDSTSGLSIWAPAIFDNSLDITFENEGTLSIWEKNDLGLIENTGVVNLDGGTTADTINNNNTLNLYNNISVTNLNNFADTYFYGSTFVENFTSTPDSNLIFVVNSRNTDPSLVLQEMIDPYEGGLELVIESTAHLKPGLINRYNLLQTRKGSLKIDAENYEEIFNILPPWLIYEQNIDFNNGENVIDGETAWVNIQRLTNYTNLISAVPNVGNNTTLLNTAHAIDSIIYDSFVTVGLEDIVNSLDFNSGCSTDEELLYLAHQGEINLDITQAPCLYTMADNIAKLQPISNELYLLYTHMRTIRSVDNLIRENKNYIYTGDVYNWYSLDMDYTSLPSKGVQSGLTSFGGLLNVGVSFSPIDNYNFSGLLGVGVGSFDSHKDRFNGYNNNLTFGLAANYFTNTYYFSLASAAGITYFYTDRQVDFIDNKYSNNRTKISESNVSVVDVTLKAEAGKEMIINQALFMTPKAFLSESFIRNDSYKEFGGSSSLVVEGENLFITDIGLGIDMNTEIFTTGILDSETAFIYPKIGLNAIYRYYPDKGTDAKFLGTTDDYMFTSEWAHYSGVLGQLLTSIQYQENQISFELGYAFDIGFSGYYNHNLSIQLKYLF